MTHHPESRSDLWSRVRHDVARERGPVAWLRARPTGARIALATALVGVVGMGVVLIVPRADLEALAPIPLAGTVFVLAGAIVAAVALLLRPYHRAAVRSRTLSVVGAVGLLLPLGLVLLAPAHDAVHAHPESFEGEGADFAARAFSCFAFGLVLGIPVLVALRLLDRRTRPTWSRIVVLAAVTGLLGNLALSLHCPLVGARHLLAGHATVPLGALAVLALARLPRFGGQGPPESVT